MKGYLKLLMLMTLISLFFAREVAADYIEPTSVTNVNKQTDLFEKSVQDLKAFEQQLEEEKNSAIKGLEGSPKALEFISDKSQGEIESEAGNLSGIGHNDLADKGRDKLIESNLLEEIYFDETKPLYIEHKKDTDRIAEASSRLLGNLLEILKDLGVDCKTVKGNKVVEPEYFIDIKRTQTKDTVYNKTICEELRNKYNCRDTLTLTCKEKGIKWDPWEDRTTIFTGDYINSQHKWMWYSEKVEKNYFICYFRPQPDVTMGLQRLIAERLGVSIEHIGALRYEYKGWRTSTGRGKEYMFPEYVVHYKYRSGNLICFRWDEDWTEGCSLK